MYYLKDIYTSLTHYIVIFITTYVSNIFIMFDMSAILRDATGKWDNW